MKISIGDILSLFALALSAYATWRTHEFRNKEGELIELQKQVNSLLIEKEQRDAKHAVSADLGANFIKLGSSKYRLKVFNKGQATARQVNIFFPEGNELVAHSDIEEKFPLALMERGQSVELLAAVHMGSPRKLTVGLSWLNEIGEKQEKVVYPTL